jgi:hypothetical protein
MATECGLLKDRDYFPYYQRNNPFVRIAAFRDVRRALRFITMVVAVEIWWRGSAQRLKYLSRIFRK